MKRFLCAFAAAPLLAVGAAAAHPPDVMSEAQVRALLQSEGFTRIDDVDYEGDGYWEAEVLTADGTELEVHVDPLSGRILLDDGAPPSSRVPPDAVRLPASPHLTDAAAIPHLGEADVRAILIDAGFHDIHDVEYDDGLWRAEAYRHGGDDVEVEIDPIDGRIVHIEDD